MLRSRVATTKTTKSVIFKNIANISKQNSKTVQLTLRKQCKKTDKKKLWEKQKVSNKMTDLNLNNYF